MKYAIVIAPLSDEDGGGFKGFVPDLRGCISDGETPAEAMANTQSAIDEWIDAANARGMTVPAPGSAAVKLRAQQARFVADLKSLAQGYENMEARLQHLEQVVEEIDERLSHADAWDRFAKIVGFADVCEVQLVSDTKPLLTR
jgi:predicted RNase H-like HicB family nuclease